MIRIDGGIMLRISDTDRFESVSTAITANDITTEVSILVVTARAEQIPSTCTAIGLSLNRGSISACF